MGEDDALELPAVLGAAHAEAGRLRREGILTEAFCRELDARFEAAAVRALRVPAFSERSAKLRRAARRVVPSRARPPLRRLASMADRVLRRVFEIAESRLERR